MKSNDYAKTNLHLIMKQRYINYQYKKKNKIGQNHLNIEAFQKVLKKYANKQTRENSCININSVIRPKAT